MIKNDKKQIVKCDDCGAPATYRLQIRTQIRPISTRSSPVSGRRSSNSFCDNCPKIHKLNAALNSTITVFGRKIFENDLNDFETLDKRGST